MPKKVATSQEKRDLGAAVASADSMAAQDTLCDAGCHHGVKLVEFAFFRGGACFICVHQRKSAARGCYCVCETSSPSPGFCLACSSAMFSSSSGSLMAVEIT